MREGMDMESKNGNNVRTLVEKQEIVENVRNLEKKDLSAAH